MFFAKKEPFPSKTRDNAVRTTGKNEFSPRLRPGSPGALHFLRHGALRDASEITKQNHSSASLLLVASASLLVTSASLVVTRSY